MTLEKVLQENSDYMNDVLDRMLPVEMRGRVGENRLARAMRYSAMAGGKRLRPFLVLQSASLFGVSRESAAQVAAAIECIHTYSLIHDDLPAMDNDDLRRGKPSCHIEFDEATALLAGDGLLTFAFEILSDITTHPDAAVRVDLVKSVATACGTRGMIGGQMIDMLSEQRELTIDQVTRLQRLKTGELFAVACESGAILGKGARNLRQSLRAYAHDLGLAFQITDDILDAEIDGASGRVDKSSEKGTYVGVLGLEKTRQQAKVIANQAVEHLRPFGKKAELLAELANFIVSRKN